MSFSFGRKLSLSEKSTGKYYVNLSSSGSFNIDKMQDFMHKILTLQPVNKVNDLVRMPDQTWFVGTEYDLPLPEEYYLFDSIGVVSYFGTDKIFIQPNISKGKVLKSLNLQVR